MIPASQWTLAKSGIWQVDILAMDDNCEMTILLGISASRHVLPPQPIYAGTTDRCHPSTKVPGGCVVTQL